MVGQDRGERLHALDRVAVADPFQHVPQRGVLPGQRLGAFPYLFGQQQLPARRGPQPVLRDLEGTLVGGLEVADLLDRVAPELHPQRVLLGGREDVQDAAAHADLAALLHRVDPAVPGPDQPADHVVEVGVLAAPQPYRLQVAQARHDRLEYGPYRRHDHLQGPAGGVPRVGVREPAQHGEPRSDGVGARRKALVGQRLPGREVRHRGRVEQARERGGEILGLPAGRRHGEHRAPGAGQGGGEHGSQRGRCDEIVGPALVQRTAQRGIGAGDVEQSGEGHQSLSLSGRSGGMVNDRRTPADDTAYVKNG